MGQPYADLDRRRAGPPLDRVVTGAFSAALLFLAFSAALPQRRPALEAAAVADVAPPGAARGTVEEISPLGLIFLDLWENIRKFVFV